MVDYVAASPGSWFRPCWCQFRHHPYYRDLIFLFENGRLKPPIPWNLHRIDPGNMPHGISIFSLHFQCVFCWLMLFLGDLWGKFSQFLQSQRRASCWETRAGWFHGDSPQKNPRQGDPRKWPGIGGGDCVREVKRLSLRYIHIKSYKHTHIYIYMI